jgi:uncharacterized membrane protein YbjE (DUF340 family)
MEHLIGLMLLGLGGIMSGYSCGKKVNDSIGYNLFFLLFSIGLLLASLGALLSVA